jgi:NAD(P)H-hydrate repair Nnr-like enzyme with NAD(P)H-hydrate dehydratase domain
MMQLLVLDAGLGTEEISEKALINFLKSKKLPLVLDADAFNF